jgi:hypothetical protein
LHGLAAWGVGDRIRTRRPGNEETQAITKGKHGRSAKMGEPGLAYCGVNCRECPVFTATVNDDNELRLKTAKEWGELYSEYIGKKELSLEDMNCRGCQSGSDLFVGCGNCPIRRCCREKDLVTCADCDEYEACGMINGFFTSAPQAKENLDRIRPSR